MKAHDPSIADMAKSLAAGTVTSTQLTRTALERIAAHDGATRAFIRVDEPAAMAAARRADLERAAGHVPSPLHGIPYAIKDVYDVGGLPTTCHSKLRLDHVAEQDSAAAQRLRQAGAVLLGKLATHEFALGGPSFDLPFPPARNPWNLDHIPGGSSSGSGVAIGAGYTRLALGTCTGGSIRIPAAWCGAVGLKPTYGRVSKRGVFPLSWSLDHCGPLTRSVSDAAIALQVLAGHDPRDPTSADVPVPDYQASLQAVLAGLRIGVPASLLEDMKHAEPDCRQAIERTMQALRDVGAKVEVVPLPAQELFLACGRVINSAEIYALHAADLRRRPMDYSELSLPRMVVGAGVGAADYLDAQKVRRRLTDDVNAALDRCDALLTAVTLGTAPAFSPTPHFRFWPVQTYAFNVTGHPAISVPVGLSGDGLPLAVQVAGRHFDEAMVLRVARGIERLSGWEAVPLPALPRRPR